MMLHLNINCLLKYLYLLMMYFFHNTLDSTNSLSSWFKRYNYEAMEPGGLCIHYYTI